MASVPDQFGGLVYLDQSTLENEPTGLGAWRRAGCFLPACVLCCGVLGSVLAFVPSIASAGASVVGSDIGWIAVVSAGTLACYGITQMVRYWQCPESGNYTTPARTTRIMTNAAVLLVSIAMLAFVALAPSVSWGLTAARATMVACSSILLASGSHQLYISAKLVTTQRIMSAYDAVLNPAAQESVTMHATVWDDAEAARKAIGTEAWQAERIHFLESQKAELTAELLRLLEDRDRSDSDEPVTGVVREDVHSLLQEQLIKYEQQASELRSVRSCQLALADEVDGLKEVKDQQSKMVLSVEAELKAERELNSNMSQTMAQMKSVLDSTIKSRDEARNKYKLLKKSVAKMVAGSVPVSSFKREVKVEEESLFRPSVDSIDMHTAD